MYQIYIFIYKPLVRIILLKDSTRIDVAQLTLKL